MGAQPKMEAMALTGKGLLEAYSGKSVFLTGHTGFKGTWLLALLRELGAKVTGYALSPDTNPSLYKLSNGDMLCAQSHIGDINDYARLKVALEEAKPDYVFHLAAQPLVRRSYTTPLHTFNTNIQGTAHLLEAVRSWGHPCSVVAITTDKVYENLERKKPYKELDPLGGYDPYSASKAGAEIVISSYRRSYFNAQSEVGLASARAGNVIGGGDWSEDRLIPDVIRAATSGIPLQVRNPNSVRPWQHVLEPLVGYLQLGALLAADHGTYSTGFNFGPNLSDTLPVKELVKVAVSAWGAQALQVEVPPRDHHAPHEAGLLRLDISKAKKLLGWVPIMNAHEAITWTIDWYKRYQDEGAYTLMVSQMHSYLDRLK